MGTLNAVTASVNAFDEALGRPPFPFSEQMRETLRRVWEQVQQFAEEPSPLKESKAVTENLPILCCAYLTGCGDHPDCELLALMCQTLSSLSRIITYPLTQFCQTLRQHVRSREVFQLHIAMDCLDEQAMLDFLGLPPISVAGPTTKVTRKVVPSTPPAPDLVEAVCEALHSLSPSLRGLFVARVDTPTKFSEIVQNNPSCAAAVLQCVPQMALRVSAVSFLRFCGPQILSYWVDAVGRQQLETLRC
jgi:hypothetical protein